MLVRSRRPPPRRRGFAAARRKTRWVTSAPGPITISSGGLSSAVDLVAGFEVAGASILGATVMRMHVALSFSSLTTDTAPGLTWGIIVWDTTIAKPDPSNDFLTPWLIADFFTPGMANGPIISGSNILYGKYMDIRAKRRLPNFNDRPFLLIKNDGSATLTYSAFVRTLLALP